MEHGVPSLIFDLSLILGVGAIVTFIFRKIKQPLVLGYIIAGIIISPNLQLLPLASIQDYKNIETLAELGVIFLLFGLGLEFSFKKLIRVGGHASVTATIEIVFISITGYITGMLLGWSTMDCLFLGGMLASSSTTIIIRAFDELGVKTKPYARVVFGVLVVEDIIVILLMVLLSTIAVTQQFEGMKMLVTVAKLGFFLILWFIMGIYLIPTFLKRVKKSMDDEGYLILSIGLCLAMVVVAVKAGFSAELGAFIMGSILAETTSAEKIEHVTKPVKDLFGVIFFVSIGMLIDPIVIWNNIWIVLLISVVIIVGKVISTTAGAIISGQSLKQSVQVGMSMAQIGEFAFIVATLGMTLGVISTTLFPVAVGVSAITTFTTPYLIKYSDKFYEFLSKVIPSKFITAINNYSKSTQTIQVKSKWSEFIKLNHITVVTSAIIALALILIGVNLLLPFLFSILPNSSPIIPKLISLLVIFAMTSPFLWAILFKYPRNMMFGQLMSSKDYKNGPLFIMMIGRHLIAFGLGFYLIDQILGLLFSLIISPFIIVILYFSSRKVNKVYSRIEKQFILNYSSREAAAESSDVAILSYFNDKLNTEEQQSTRNINLVDLEVSQDAQFGGLTLEKLNWSNRFGINVIYIKRGEHLIYPPEKGDRVLPFDRIGVAAIDKDLDNFIPIFNAHNIFDDRISSNVEDIEIIKIVAGYDNDIMNVRLSDSGIRERTGGLVIGIERKDDFIVPNPDTLFEEKDIIWIVGEHKKLALLYTNNKKSKKEKEEIGKG